MDKIERKKIFHSYFQDYVKEKEERHNFLNKIKDSTPNFNSISQFYVVIVKSK